MGKLRFKWVSDLIDDLEDIKDAFEQMQKLGCDEAILFELDGEFKEMSEWVEAYKHDVWDAFEKAKRTAETAEQVATRDQRIEHG